MNDFTKEELRDLFNCCEAAYIAGEINPQAPLRLQSKLKSMIDNYCEHENSHSITLGDTAMICNKCETILGHWSLRKAKV